MEIQEHEYFYLVRWDFKILFSIGKFLLYFRTCFCLQIRWTGQAIKDFPYGTFSGSWVMAVSLGSICTLQMTTFLPLFIAMGTACFIHVYHLSNPISIWACGPWPKLAWYTKKSKSIGIPSKWLRWDMEGFPK